MQLHERTLKLLRRCLMEKAWPEGCTQHRCRRSAACFAPSRFPGSDSPTVSANGTMHISSCEAVPAHAVMSRSACKY